MYMDESINVALTVEQIDALLDCINAEIAIYKAARLHYSRVKILQTAREKLIVAYRKFDKL